MSPRQARGTLRSTTGLEGAMKRMMIVARRRADAHDEAEILLREGPPFDPETVGLEAHAAWLTAAEGVFLFEAPEIEWIVNELIDDPAIAVFSAQRKKLIAGTPPLAQEHYHRSREK